MYSIRFFPSRKTHQAKTVSHQNPKMSTLNPFDLLGGDAEDPSQIVVSLPKKVEKEAPAQPAKGAKLQTKQPPTSQAGKFSLICVDVEEIYCSDKLVSV